MKVYSTSVSQDQDNIFQRYLKRTNQKTYGFLKTQILLAIKLQTDFEFQNMQGDAERAPERGAFQTCPSDTNT